MSINYMIVRKEWMDLTKDDAVKDQHRIIGINENINSKIVFNPHPDARWFKKGGNLGMFIHYGLSAVNGSIDLSWGMIANKPYENRIGCEYRISPENYWALEKDFNPCNFEKSMDRLMSALKETGFTYAVLTTKHHDGFALWESKYGNLNIGKYNKGVDLVKIFADTCRRYGLKVGFYYSPPDWNYLKDYMSFSDAGLLYDTKHNKVDSIPVADNSVMDDYRKYLRGQITELLTNYGHVDILWFDGSCEKPFEVITPDEIRKLQPGIIFNNRHFGYGDFMTPEVRFPVSKPEKPWEYCGIWTDGVWWSYMHQCKKFKSAEWLYDIYQKCQEWNGNCLINVGPMSDGTMPEMTYTRLKELNGLLRNC